MASSTDSNDSLFYSTHSKQNQEELVQDDLNSLINRMTGDKLTFYGSAPQEFWCQVSPVDMAQEDLQLEVADDDMGSLDYIDPSDLELGEEIAEGGQAHVFLAVWTRYHWVYERVPVVAKRLKGLKSDVGESKSLRQLRNMVGIGGMCLCIVLGVCVKNTGVFVVMERMLGDVRNFMDFALIPTLMWNDPATCLDIKLYMIWCIASGMQELHMRGLLHRDLKASNILFGSLSEVNKEHAALDDGYRIFFPFSIKVGDYESSEGVMGTGFWRAPEVLQQLNKGVTPVTLTDKADVYSYAMLCYEILTGCIPFADRYDLVFQRQLVCSKVISGERPELPATLDEGLRRFLMRCWDDDPVKRPNFEEMTHVLGCVFKILVPP